MYSLAYLGFNSIEEIEKMTLVEYQLRMEAYQISQVRLHENIALQAFFNQMVQATTGSKKHPKPKYNSLEKLFDAKSEIEQIRSKFEGESYSHNRPISKADRKQIFAQRYDEWQKIKAKRRGRRRLDG
ncbi:hypothetical protein [Pediococcus pentosaceus]|uniref:hypothetical protein n=1 Tax=Pediococcus pentosaceus TaxID=1255 RepID=UPI001F39648D|nr:hypothetical protein [Pediococcus pentosaceus]